MILDVAHHVVVAEIAAILRGFELGHHLFVWKVDDVRDHVETSAMRHAEHRIGDAVIGEHVEHLLEHRHHDVEPLAREGLLPEERFAHVAIEGFDLRQPLEEVDLPLR